MSIRQISELRGLSKVCQVTNAYAQAPSFQKMATQMGIVDFHQFLSQPFSGKSPLRTGSAVIQIVFRFGLLSHLRLCNDDQFIQLHSLESNFKRSAALRNLTFWDGHLPKLLIYTLVQDNRQGFVKLWGIPSAHICQVVELVKTKVKAEFGSEVFGMLDALSECMEKISKASKRRHVG